MSHAAWAKAQPDISARAKGVLRCLADYADPEGFCCVTVKVLEVETSANARTVQRGLSELREARLLLATDRFFVFGGRRVPVYRLAIEKGPQNTRQRLAAVAEAVDAAVDTAGGEAGDEAATGDKGVTPSEGAGCQDCHPTGDKGVTPRVTAVSPKEKVRKGNRSVCVARAHADEGAEPDAALRYLAEAGEVQRGRVKSMHGWLAKRDYELWLATPGSGAGDLFNAPARPRFPDEAIRAAFAAEADEAFVRSYLDPAALDGRTIIPRTDTARTKLGEQRALLARLGLALGAAGAATTTNDNGERKGRKHG